MSSKPKHDRLNTFNGVLYIPDKEREKPLAFLAKDKENVDRLREKRRMDTARMESFWKGIETQTCLTYHHYLSHTFLKDRLETHGCSERVAEYEELLKDLDGTRRKIENYAKHGRRKQLQFFNSKERQVEEQPAESMGPPKKKKVDVDEYELEDRARTILERYPEESAKELYDLITRKSDKSHITENMANEWKESVQADMLLLDTIIDQMEHGVRRHLWEVDIPDLDSSTYSYMTIFRTSSEFTTMYLTDAKKRELVKKAEKELIEELQL